MGRNLVLVTCNLTKKMIEEIENMLQKKIYPSRSELIRVAVRDLLIKEFVWGTDPQYLERIMHKDESV
jgi:Arc/MetJ-type ribon-helix-helix transcriptional regulator